MAAKPTPPERRLRMKTPDPASRHKSPDARALKRAYKDLKDANKKATKAKGGESASGGEDLVPRKLTFAKEPIVTTIQAENPPKSTKPSKTAKEPKMTTEQADEILAQFSRNKSAASASETEASQAQQWGSLHHQKDST